MPIRAVAEAAVAANPWFTLSDVVFSVDAVRRNMLDAAVSARWLSYYGANERTVRSRVAVIMAGNIPLVGLSDLLCVVASDCIPYIKMSSKDSVLMDHPDTRMPSPEAPAQAKGPPARGARRVHGPRHKTTRRVRASRAQSDGSASP